MSDSTTKILQDIAAGIITPEEGQALLSKKSDKCISLKVGPKGGICIYGLRRMPITLYYEELNAIMEHIMPTDWKYNDYMQTFLEENDSKLSKGKTKSKSKS